MEIEVLLNTSILNQILVNKYSGFKTIFYNDKEYILIRRINNRLILKSKT